MRGFITKLQKGHCDVEFFCLCSYSKFSFCDENLLDAEYLDH